jgi:hypothetical protein
MKGAERNLRKEEEGQTRAVRRPGDRLPLNVGASLLSIYPKAAHLTISARRLTVVVLLGPAHQSQNLSLWHNTLMGLLLYQPAQRRELSLQKVPYVLVGKSARDDQFLSHIRQLSLGTIDRETGEQSEKIDHLLALAHLLEIDSESQVPSQPNEDGPFVCSFLSFALCFGDTCRRPSSPKSFPLSHIGAFRCR